MFPFVIIYIYIYKYKYWKTMNIIWSLILWYHRYRSRMDRLACLGDLLTVKGLAPKAWSGLCVCFLVFGALNHGYAMVMPWLYMFLYVFVFFLLYHGFIMWSPDCESTLTSFRSGQYGQESYGHGFDILGMTLDWWLEITWTMVR